MTLEEVLALMSNWDACNADKKYILTKTICCNRTLCVAERYLGWWEN